MTDKEIIDFFQNDKYATEQIGIKIEEIKDKYAKCSLEITSKHQNALGFLMGGVAYTMADFTFAVATKSGIDGITVSTVGQIKYLNPCRGKKLFSESELIKDGKTVCFYRIRIKDDLDNQIAEVDLTGTHIGYNPAKKTN